jgi:hypothetical protein
MMSRGLRKLVCNGKCTIKASINYAAAIRKNVVDKINMMLKTDIEKYIISESTFKSN